jgi:hypothetical protein
MTRGIFALMILTMIILVGGRQTHAQSGAEPQLTAPEAWAWSQIALGQPAELDAYCQKTAPDSAAGSHPRAPCREIRGATIVRFLTQAPWRNAIPSAGLGLVGAWVRGDIDLVNAHVEPALTLIRSQVEGHLWLTRAHLDGLLALDRSEISGEIDAVGLQAGADISLSDGRGLVPRLQFEPGFHAGGKVTLENAQIGGSLLLSAATFDQDLDVRGAHVGGDVKATNAQIGNNLRGASMHVAGNLDLIGMHVDGDVNLTGLNLAGDLLLVDAPVDPDQTANPPPDSANPCVSIDRRPPAFLGDFSLAGASIGGAMAISGIAVEGQVSLINTHVNGTMQMDRTCLFSDLQMGSLQVNGNLHLGGAHVWGKVSAADLHVVHDLDFGNAVFENEVNLFGAQIGDTVHFENALFLAKLGAPGLHASSDLILNGARFAAQVDLSRSSLGGDLNLAHAYFVTLDLARADIHGALLVDRTTTWEAPADRLRQFDMTNTHLGTLPDLGATEARDCPGKWQDPVPTGWPNSGMALDGLTYDHLSETGRQAGADRPASNVCWWDWWLKQDSTFSEQPYLELASVMAAHGDQGDASDIAYYGRLRDTRLAWDGGQYGRWLLLFLFDVTVGYGIGGYSWHALIWVGGLTLLGARLLQNSKGGSKHSAFWRLGASLSRVLPIIEINREFSDFFNDPKRENLTGRQIAIFSVVAIIGWALGLFIVAALSGLTQHS